MISTFNDSTCSEIYFQYWNWQPCNAIYFQRDLLPTNPLSSSWVYLAIHNLTYVRLLSGLVAWMSGFVFFDVWTCIWLSGLVGACILGGCYLHTGYLQAVTMCSFRKLFRSSISVQNIVVEPWIQRWIPAEKFRGLLFYFFRKLRNKNI